MALLIRGSWPRLAAPHTPHKGHDERSGREWAFLRFAKSFIIEVCTRCG